MHEINDRYRKLLRIINFKGNLISESLQKHRDFATKVESFLPWLAEVERKLARESQEQTPSDSRKLQRKIEVVKVCLVRNYFYHREHVFYRSRT